MYFHENSSHKWALFSTQIHVTQEVHNSAKWSRQQWSIMWERALHKSNASKNRNVAMADRSWKCCDSKRPKRSRHLHLGATLDMKRTGGSTNAAPRACVCVKESVWVSERVSVSDGGASKLWEKLKMQTGENTWTLWLFWCVVNICLQLFDMYFWLNVLDWCQCVQHHKGMDSSLSWV